MANALALLANALVPHTKAAVSMEGEYRPGPWQIDGGWLPAGVGKFWNWWQLGASPHHLGDGGAMVEACVSAYSQTFATCPGDHWIASKNAAGNNTGGRERITSSALSRLLRQPNDYQSMSDLMLNLGRTLYTNGEAFGIGLRNGRVEISELHWMRNGYPVIAEDGSIFYQLSGNEIVERRYDLSLPIPARDVLHVRLHTPRHPLKGVSPIVAVALERQMAGAALSQQIAFYLNQARPSFILETDKELSKSQADDLRDRWDKQTQGEKAGGTPILSWGLKARPITMGAGDARLAEMLKLTNENIALAFRIPQQILGIGDKATWASTEALMSSWKALSLGFGFNHIEQAFDRLFGLRGYPDEYVEFDTNMLLRSSFKERIEALSAGTRRLYTINEARGLEGLPAVPGGDEIRVQQQDVPLSWVESQPQMPALPPPKAANDGERADAESVIRAFRAARDRALAA